MACVTHYASKQEAYGAVARRHGVELDDIDIIPHPRLDAAYLSYGPADEDVELVSWDELSWDE